MTYAYDDHIKTVNNNTELDIVEQEISQSHLSVTIPNTNLHCTLEWNRLLRASSKAPHHQF